VLGMSPPASGAGYYYSDSGIVSTGRGGAWIAGADSQFAQFHNPAGLIHVAAPTFNAGWSAVQQRTSFTPLLSSDPEEFGDTIDNEARPFNVPQMGYVTPVGENFAFAFGFVSPYAPSSEYPADGEQRYAIINSTIYQFGLGPALAWRPVDLLTLGVNFQWQYLQVGQELAATLSGDTDPAGDINIDLMTVDLFTPHANFGLLFDPLPALTIGVMVQPPSAFKAKGAIAIDFSGNAFEDLIEAPDCGAPDPEDCPKLFEDPDINLDISLPLVIKTGVAVRPIPRLEIETAFVYQRWKSLTDLRVTNIDLSLTVAILGEQDIDDTIALPASFRDAYSVRLGGEFDVTDQVAIRLGGFYEASAVEPKMVSIALMDTPKFQLGTGASLNLLDDRLTVDGAFAWLFFQNLNVRDSEVTQINAGVADPELPLPGLSNDSQVVGNGDLASYGWIVGTQLSWAFHKRD
jgi:long-chain fatty acid transport protein